MRWLIGKWRWSLVFTLIIAVGVYLTVGNRHESDQAEHYFDKRIIKYSFTLENPTNRFIESASFWAYLPLQQTAFQKRVNVSYSHPANSKLDSSGNEKVIFEAKDIPPFGSQVFSISAELDISKNPNHTPPVDVSSYLRSEKYVESDDPRIVTIANGLKAGTTSNTTINIQKWVSKNLSDAGFVKRDHGARYALDKKSGDCTEFMNLFLALARASGIPARGVAGYIVKENTILKPRNYHNWAEVYIDDTWRVVDPLNNLIFEDENRYIAMRYVGNSVEDYTENSQRFFDSDVSIRVSMN